MNIKKKIIFTILLISVLISLSSINAAETNGNSTDYLNKQLSIDNADFTNLADEINKSSNAKEIKLTQDYIYNPSNDEKHINGIDIEIENFIIDGQGHTINGNKQARIFTIKSNNVVLKNINLINGFTNEHGGSVYWTGENGTIINSNFKDNYASRYGGAVSFKWTGTIINSNFENNKAGTGGAIDFGDESKILNSTFKNNHATFLGGAIFIYRTSIIKNSKFTGNVGGDGGGIYSDGKTWVYNTTFTLNQAIGYGGGICLSTEGHVINSTFTQNTAKLEGGAILTKSSSQNIFNCIFNHNDAKEGKSLYIQAYTVKLENLTFNNQNSSFGLEIHNESKTSQFVNLSFNNISKTDLNPKENKTTIENNVPAQSHIKIIFKKKTTIKGKAKSFKSSQKSKKYTIILKSGKTPIGGKKIKLIINGKNYISRTNKKGKAVFKLKLFKKGTYKAKISFNGDSRYKSSKINVKIKIK